MSTDASFRFERGVDPDGMTRAAARAAAVILATAGGTVQGEPLVADAGVESSAPIRLRPQRVAHVLGVDVGADEASALLVPLGFGVERSGEDLVVRVPGHRRYDVEREADLIEEVARRRGYDSFPEEARPFRPSTVPDDPMAVLEDRLRTDLVAWGFLEARSVPFVSESDGDVELLLPLASTESRLRRALAPGLVRRVAANFNRGARDIRLFEIGTVFAPGEGGIPRESTRLAAVMTGARAPLHWSGSLQDWDFWDLRGLAEDLGRVCGLRLIVGKGPDGRSWITPVPGTLLGLRGAGEDWSGLACGVAPAALDAPAWAAPVWALEFELDVAMNEATAHAFRPLPIQPAVERDMALLLPSGTAAAPIEDTIRSAAGPTLESVVPFDVYVGEGLTAGTRSVAFRLRFRAPDRTLTDKEVDRFVSRVLDRLREEHNVERRS